MAKCITIEGLQAVLQLIKQDVKIVDDKIEAIQIPSIEGLATEAFVNEKIAAILGADNLAEDLDSLKEVIDVFDRANKTVCKDGYLEIKIANSDIKTLEKMYKEYLEDDVGYAYGWNSDNAYAAAVIENQLGDISKITEEYYELSY